MRDYIKQQEHYKIKEKIIYVCIIASIIGTIYCLYDK